MTINGVSLRWRPPKPSFIDADGLSVIKPDAQHQEGGSEIGRVAKLASWIDESRSRLAPYEREFADKTIGLGKAA